MKFKVELDVPDFPEETAIIQSCKLSILLGTVGSTEIMNALMNPNQTFGIVQPDTKKLMGTYMMDGRANTIDGETADDHVEPVCKTENTVENALDGFFNARNNEKGSS